MKKNIKTKKTKFLSHNVEYFTSNKAIDGLMKSKFAEGDSALFTTREQAVDFLDSMLEHKLFHRAKKVPVSTEELRGLKPPKKEDSSKEKQTKKEKDAEAEAEASGNNGVSDEAGGTSASGEKKEKKKRKIRLDMHPEQVFVDGSEAYVWIYDPIPIHYWIYGLILLLGAIGICMFPLWPPMLRKGVYYLSLVAAGFLVFMLALTVVRLIIFTIVWLVTAGKLHFWIFPNLTEDVGFFASFWPLYEVICLVFGLKEKLMDYFLFRAIMFLMRNPRTNRKNRNQNLRKKKKTVMLRIMMRHLMLFPWSQKKLKKLKNMMPIWN